MSTIMYEKTNGCYTISARRFYGGKERGMLTTFEIGDSEHTIGIALTKKEAIDLCATIIQSLNELGNTHA